MNTLIHLAARFVHWAFWYCTDFMVNLANLTHTSYDEANTWVLLILTSWPAGIAHWHSHCAVVSATPVFS